MLGQACAFAASKSNAFAVRVGLRRTSVASFPVHVESVGLLLVFPGLVYQLVYTALFQRNLDTINQNV